MVTETSNDNGFSYVSFDNISAADNPSGALGTTEQAVARDAAGDQTTTGTGRQRREDALPPRATWGKKVEFMLTAVSFAVGLGNVWRFPHLCYKNGGGAFLLPYVFMLFGVGLPLYFLEVSLGQFASRGSLTVWPRICPVFKGLGYGMTVVALMVSLYYNVIVSLTVFYFFASFSKHLPWAECKGWWIKGPCVDKEHHWGYYVRNSTDGEEQHLQPGDEPLPDDAVIQEWHGNITSPAEEYWKHYVNGLDNTVDLGSVGHVQWRLALCLLFAWFIVYLCIAKGIKSSGKVAYFTAIFPYIVLSVLFIRGVTLPGAGNGVKFYLKPDFKKMGHAKVWRDAAVQILYSLGPGFGGLLTIGSYNKFYNNCHKDTLVIAFINCGTSVFAGFVIFSVLGFMSHRSGTPIANVVEEGPGLAFIAYPEALAALPGDAWISNFFSILFFFMLFTLGIGSMFPGTECIITGLTDEFPWLARRKKWLTPGMCVVLFLLGLPCTTQGGMYVIELIDTFATSFPLLFLTLGEIIAIIYIYGFRKFLDDVQQMIGFRPNYYWPVCWVVITPVLLLFVLVFSCVDYDGIELNGYKYPAWGEVVGWLMSLSSIIMLPLWAIIEFFKRVETWHNFVWLFKNPRAATTLDLVGLFKPTPEWGPALEEHREQSVRYNTRLDVIDILDIKDPDNSGMDGVDNAGRSLEPVESDIGVAQTAIDLNTEESLNHTNDSSFHLRAVELDLGEINQQGRQDSHQGSPIYSVI